MSQNILHQSKNETDPLQGKRVIIVGGGFAGISVAKQLRNSQFDVTLIDRSNHHLFQPLLYQVATAALSPGDIATPIRSLFSKTDNVHVVMGDVREINKGEQYIQLKEGDRYSFDYLIIAAGAQYQYFGNDEWNEHAPGLKTLNDALKIRDRILLSLEKAEKRSDPSLRRKYLTYAVIGGGPTGVEMAGSIAEIVKRNMMRDFRNIKPSETRIHLIEAAGGILNSFPEKLTDKALKDLENMGVTVHLNTPVKGIRKDGVQIEGEFIETPNIIWAAGVSASPLLKELDEETDRMGRVLVRDDLSIPSNNTIFVIGDAAHVKDKNGQPLPGIAPVALQQGKYLGKRLLKSDPKPFSYVDKGSMATIGRAKAIADIRGFTFSGLFAWLLWGLIHIFFLIGFRNRFRVFAEWVWHYATFKRGVRLISKEDEVIEAEVQM